MQQHANPGPIYSYRLQVVNTRSKTEPPYTMEFDSVHESMAAGAAGEFTKKHPDLQILQGATLIGTLLF